MAESGTWLNALWKNRNNKEHEKITHKVNLHTVTPDDDGSVVISSSVRNSNLYHFEWDLDNQVEQIQMYRKIALHADVDYAVEDICNEAINYDDVDTLPVTINLEDVDLSDAIKKKISEEYLYIMNLLDFRNRGFDQFKEWYVDGRAFYHMIVDKRPKAGLIGIRKFDTCKMRRVKEVQQDPESLRIINEDVYYIYDETLGRKKNQATKDHQPTKNVIKFPEQSIAYLDTGLFDPHTGYARSHLHKAIKAANQLMSIEDATVVYRLVRAPERRVFYVDVGNLPKTKAEQYVGNLASSYRKKMLYDGTTGEVAQKNHHVAMQEDIWLPRKGGKGTEVSTLAGGQNLGEIEDIEYFLKKLYKALNVPLSRLDTSSVFNIGRTSEIARDELKFNKFVIRLRKKYTGLFLQFLRTQLILKGIIKENDWDKISQQIKFTFSQDMAITEQKANDLLHDRLDIVEKMEPIVGKYFSHEYIMRQVLKMTDEEIKQEEARIKKEENDPRFQPDDEDDFGGGPGFGEPEPEPEPGEPEQPEEPEEPETRPDDPEADQPEPKDDDEDEKDKEKQS